MKKGKAFLIGFFVPVIISLIGLGWLAFAKPFAQLLCPSPSFGCVTADIIALLPTMLYFPLLILVGFLYKGLGIPSIFLSHVIALFVFGFVGGIVGLVFAKLINKKSSLKK